LSENKELARYAGESTGRMELRAGNMLTSLQIVQDARLPREQIASEAPIFGDLNIASF
jgi:hypothetical protein